VPFKNNKLHRINPTAAPAAMKDSAKARTVIAAPDPDSYRDGREVNGGSVNGRFV